MPGHGKIYDTDGCAGPGKAKADGGRSFGKKSKLNKSGRETPLPKQVGTPRDKGVNR
jgi:hypothetical protein